MRKEVKESAERFLGNYRMLIRRFFETKNDGSALADSVNETKRSQSSFSLVMCASNIPIVRAASVPCSIYQMRNPIGIMKNPPLFSWLHAELCENV